METRYTWQEIDRLYYEQQRQKAKPTPRVKLTRKVR
jgi:hypothetical protein